MDEKTEEIINQYPIEIVNRKRIRGAILLDTKDGLYTIVNYKDSVAKLEFEESIKEYLIENNYVYVDKVIKNVNNEWITKDNYGNPFVMKKWYEGRECDLKNYDQTVMAGKHLAMLHEKLVMPDTDQNISEKKHNDETILNVLKRHEKEMKRVYNYIRNKNKRNEMELFILNQFPYFYEQAHNAISIGDDIPCESMEENAKKEGRVFHGNFNYHNIIFLKNDNIATVNFQRAAKGLQLIDLYDLIRKIMEKNNWEKNIGIETIKAYHEIKPLNDNEKKLLMVLLLFPEKYWKQMNFYYNGNKSLLLGKNMDKLVKLKEQEEARKKFLEKLKGVLI